MADGPDYPECDDQGRYEPRQCNDMTGVCWCVDPQVGSMIPGTEGAGNCDGEFGQKDQIFIKLAMLRRSV